MPKRRVTDDDADDETLAGTTHGGGAETEIVSVDYPPTGSSEMLEAWSAAEEFEDLDAGSWGAMFSRAAFPLFMVSAMAFGIALAGWLMIDNRRQDTPVQQTVGAPSIVVAPTPDIPSVPDVPPVMPPDAQHLPTGPALFNVLLARAGITVVAGSDGLTLAAQVGHGICGSLAQGVSGSQIEADTVAQNHFADGSAPTPAQAHAFVAAAEQVFCPQYGPGQ
jgi:hypothetical protein